MRKVVSSILPSFFFLIIFSAPLYTQTVDLQESYENYTEAPREIAFIHLNKSTYIEGEMLGFKAYVFDKYTKAPSRMTSNLYCTISNKDGQIIKQSLVRVKQGVAHNLFEIDSTFSSDIYTFKAYTNWMRNFDELNHFEQTFKVIDADNLDKIKPVSPEDFKIDLQVLGEGGHILYNVENTVGIIAKNQFGQGISSAYGSITDENKNIVSEFQLNKVGLAKTLFKPKPNTNYYVSLSLNENTIRQPINNIKTNGLVISLVATTSEIKIILKTNSSSLNSLKDESFKIALHNGAEMVLSDFNLSTNGNTILTYSKEELFTGINMFTIFDNNNRPILERLYFNKDGLKQITFSDATVVKSNDSIDITLNTENLNTDVQSSFSISALPSSTKSYVHHNNILSQLFIQPYIKGNIENATDYFKDTNKEIEYNLDLLMLTQGWSSYDWKSIFTQDDREYIYPFEKGIDIVANIQSKASKSYIVYPLAQNTTKLFDIPEGEKEFTMKSMFPTKDDIFRVGSLDSKNKKFDKKPSLYLQYYPSEFPILDKSIDVLEQVYSLNETSIKPNLSFDASQNPDVTSLDEVVINANKNYTQVEALKEKATIEKYVAIEKNIKLRGMRLDLYLQRLGYATDFDVFSGTLSIINPRIPSKFVPGDPNYFSDTARIPLVYLDDTLLTTGNGNDFRILTFYTMDLIDYIEYEIYGIGGGIRGQAGYIKIYTSPGTKAVNPTDNLAIFDIPLKFENDKSFYVPKYEYYNTDFFKEYGTIDWKPNISLDKNGKANFKLYNTKTKMISLFIEGIIDDNQYISQELKIEIPD